MKANITQKPGRLGQILQFLHNLLYNVRICKLVDNLNGINKAALLFEDNVESRLCSIKHILL